MLIAQNLNAIVLLSVLGGAVVSDFRCHRIPNALILIGLVLGVFAQSFSAGFEGVGAGFLGVLLGLGLFLPFYALGGMSAGDVKLMAMAGFFLGPVAVLSAVAFTLMAGCLFALLFLAKKQQFFRLVRRYWAMASLRTYIAPQASDAARQRFPYAIAIFTGVLASLFWQPFGL